MIRLVLFDCDGTLVDSQHLISAAMAETFRAVDLEAPPIAAVRRVVGLSLEEAITRLLPEARRDEAPILSVRYKENYFRLKSDPEVPQDELFDGARETLHALHRANFLLGVATGKSRRGLRATLERHGLAGLFVTLQTADDAPGKPDPTMALQAMTEAGVEPGETVVIGDTVFDIMMARHAGADALGVSWGYHDPHELAQAGAIGLLERFHELPPRLASLNNMQTVNGHGR
ncbi:MAG: HAD-IA family hydrolase [Alphaproteobacteria bacterium]|nr:HAD-IA family hydrolase [Alphaproteobacteria bacterium]